MEPHAALGLEPGASPEEIHRAYRRLAKRFHPDHAGDAAGDMMISINAAYDMLRDQVADAHVPATNGVDQGGAGSARREGPRIAGDWLPAATRRILARELLATLEEGEQIDEVVLTSTGDSHDVQLAVTDRRLLWLRDDAIMGRVRYLRYRDLAGMEQREGGRLRRRGHLRVQARNSGRRLRFYDLPPEVLRRVMTAIRARTSA